MTKAVVFERFGTEHLRLVSRQADKPGPGEVRVRVASVSLNYRDLLMVRGHYNPRLKLPLIPCSDGAGTVIECGPDVTSLTPGDRVCSTMIPDWPRGSLPEGIHKTTLGGPLDGLLCEERTLPERAWLKIPDYLDFDQAACLPVAGLTAWSALVPIARTGKGSKVLLLGTGGVSIMGLGIAKSLGAEVVITSSSEEKLARAKTLGADHSVNYREQPKWSAAVRALFPHGVDCVLEVGGAGTFNQSVASTRVGGCVALIGVLADNPDPVNLTAVLMKGIRVQGTLVGSRASFADYLQYLSKHPLAPVVDKVFHGLDRAAEAFALMERGGHFGKIVIRLA